MYRRSSSIFAERVRASLSRRDPGAMVNELTERVVSATLSQGMVTDKEDFEWCLRRLIVRTVSRNGTEQHTLFGMPIAIIAELAVAALQESIRFSADLPANRGGQATQGAHKHWLAKENAAWFLESLLRVDDQCVPEERLFGESRGGNGVLLVRHALYEGFDSLLFALSRTLERNCGISREDPESRFIRLFAAGFAELWQREGPLRTVQSLYSRCEPDTVVFRLVTEELRLSGRRGTFMQQGFSELYAAAAKAFKSDNAQSAASLWNAARGLCALEDIEPEDAFESELLVWMQLGHTIRQVHAALANDEYSIISDAVAALERIYRQQLNPSLPGVPLRACVGALLRRFGYDSGATLVTRLQNRYEEHLQVRISERAEYMARAEFPDGMRSLYHAVHALALHRSLWRYPVNAPNAPDRERLERRRVFRQIFDGFSEEAKQRLSVGMPGLLATINPSVEERKMYNEMHQAFMDQAQFQVARSKDVERAFV